MKSQADKVEKGSWGCCGVSNATEAKKLWLRNHNLLVVFTTNDRNNFKNMVLTVC
jgi:hypothetical protein